MGVSHELAMVSRFSTWVRESKFKTVDLYPSYILASSKKLILMVSFLEMAAVFRGLPWTY